MNREEIIGQDTLLDTIDNLIATDKLPQFIILNGMKGSGRKTIATYIAEKLNATLYKSQEGDVVNVDYVRSMIEESYKRKDKTVYLISDVGSRKSIALVKDILLKVTEEPPMNAYFIMTTDSSMNTNAHPLNSRATLFKVRPCTPEQLLNYAKSIGITDITPSVLNIFDTIGDVINYKNGTLQYNSLSDFIEVCIDNIGTTSGSNSFKIADKIAFNIGDDGFNLQIFWMTFASTCMNRQRNLQGDEKVMLLNYIKTTNTYVNKLALQGINKRALFDTWVLDIREIYNKYH